MTTMVANAIGANVFYTRLQGHGEGPAALAASAASHWLEDYRQALDIGAALGKNIVVIACSTGATLAVNEALQNPRPDVGAYVLLSPNLGLRHPCAPLLGSRFAPWLLRLIVGDTYAFQPVNERHGRFWVTRYPAQALQRMYAPVAEVRRRNWRNFDAPLLVCSSPADRLVDPRQARRLHDLARSPIKQYLEINNSADPQAHVLAGDILSPGTTAAVADGIVEFLRRLPTA